MFHQHALTTTTAALLLLVASATADVPRPRGVPLTQATLYRPRPDNKSWVCLDGSRTLRYEQINDDYCDCEDGSDEPGTSACAQGRFHCANLGHRAELIPSSRVNDGVCDCCDASDEYNGNANCPNTCSALGQAEQQQRRNEAELHKRGAARRQEMIATGKQQRAERETRRADLERRRSEQEALKAEKEELKRSAEVAEAEALEVYKELAREHEAEAEAARLAAGGEVVGEEGGEEARSEAEASFMRYDTNKDGFVEITELQVDMTLDRDRNGVVTVEEAKYFLDERERIDLDAFIMLSWPRIKPLQMLAQGLFKPPMAEGEAEHVASENAEQSSTPAIPEYAPQHPHEDVEELDTEAEHEEEDHYDEDDEADVGVGTAHAEDLPATPATPPPEYDPETQRLIEIANEARHAFSEVEREMREIEHEIKEIDDLNAKDYGPHEEYATMDGECYRFEDREYVYKLCPFDRASQQQRSGGAETTLGRWDQWVAGDDGNRYAKQRYAHGASCWNGPQRSAVVHLRCALEHRITAVSEPNRCEYYFAFETPAACDSEAYAAAAAAGEEEEQLHDEL